MKYAFLEVIGCNSKNKIYYTIDTQKHKSVSEDKTFISSLETKACLRLQSHVNRKCVIHEPIQLKLNLLPDN